MSAAEQEAARMAAFERLTREQQADAIRRMVRDGVPEYTVAAATRLSIEMIRRILGEGAR